MIDLRFRNFWLIGGFALIAVVIVACLLPAPVIAPVRGMTQSQFDGVLWGVKDADLAAAQTTSGKSIDANYLRSGAKLQARSDGQYYLQVNRDDDHPQYAVTKGGAPFVLDLRGRKSAPIDAYDPLALSGALP